MHIMQQSLCTISMACSGRYGCVLSTLALSKVVELRFKDVLKLWHTYISIRCMPCPVAWQSLSLWFNIDAKNNQHLRIQINRFWHCDSRLPSVVLGAYLSPQHILLSWLRQKKSKCHTSLTVFLVLIFSVVSHRKAFCTFRTCICMTPTTSTVCTRNRVTNVHQCIAGQKLLPICPHHHTLLDGPSWQSLAFQHFSWAKFFLALSRAMQVVSSSTVIVAVIEH